MAWHKDKQIKADIGIFRAIFPEQTKTPARIVIWSIILLADLIGCVYGAFYFGVLSAEHLSKGMIAVVLIVAVALVWLQGFVFGAITRLVKKAE